MNKKKVFTLALAICLIAILSMSSLAWFTAEDEVTNEFLVAGSENGDPDDIFSVDVWEDKDGDGQPDNDVDGDGEGLIYNDILPGDKLIKIAHVENTGSYDQYIRVKIEISDAFAWALALGEDYGDETLLEVFGGFEQTAWEHITTESVINEETGENVIRIEMYFKYILPVDGDITVFTHINIPKSLTKEQAAWFSADGEPGFTINVTADAVQTENLADNAYDSFAIVENNN